VTSYATFIDTTTRLNGRGIDEITYYHIYNVRTSRHVSASYNGCYNIEYPDGVGAQVCNPNPNPNTLSINIPPFDKDVKVPQCR